MISVSGVSDIVQDVQLARAQRTMTSMPLVPVDARAATASLPPSARETGATTVAVYGSDYIVGGSYVDPSRTSRAYVARVTQSGSYVWSHQLPDESSVDSVGIGAGSVLLSATGPGGSAVFRLDASTGTQAWRASLPILATRTYVSADNSGGAYLAAAYAGGVYLADIDAGGGVSRIGADINATSVSGAHTASDGSLLVGIVTSVGTRIERYFGGALDLSLAISIPSGGQWAVDRTSGSIYVAGRDYYGDRVVKYASDYTTLWSASADRVSGGGSSSTLAMAADAGSIYFARRVWNTGLSGAELTVSVAVADGLDGYLNGSYLAWDAGQSRFGGYDLGIRGFAVAGGRAAVVGTTNPLVFKPAWDAKGGQWPSLESVSPYGYLAVFSAYGDAGVLQAGPSIGDPVYDTGRVAIDSSGNRYVIQTQQNRVGTLTKTSSQGAVQWVVVRPTNYDSTVSVVDSGSNAGVYVAGLTQPVSGCEDWAYQCGGVTGNVSKYDLDGNLLWSIDPTEAVQSATRGPSRIFASPRPDGTVFVAATYLTDSSDPGGMGAGMYLAIAGPSGVSGQYDDYGGHWVTIDDAHGTPDGSSLYILERETGPSRDGRMVRVKADLLQDASFAPISLTSLEIGTYAGTFALDDTGSVYVLIQHPSFTATYGDGCGVDVYALSKYDQTGSPVWTVHPHWRGSFIGSLAMTVAGGRLFVAAATSWSTPDTYVDHAPITVWSTGDGTLLDQEQVASDLPASIQPQSIAANDAGSVVVRGYASLFVWPWGQGFEQTYRWTTP